MPQMWCPPNKAKPRWQAVGSKPAVGHTTSSFIQGHPALLPFADATLYKLEACSNPASGKSVGNIFPTAFAHCVSVTEFGDPVFPVFSSSMYLLW